MNELAKRSKQLRISFVDKKNGKSFECCFAIHLVTSFHFHSSSPDYSQAVHMKIFLMIKKQELPYTFLYDV